MITKQQTASSFPQGIQGIAHAQIFAWMQVSKALKATAEAERTAQVVNELSGVLQAVLQASMQSFLFPHGTCVSQFCTVDCRQWCILPTIYCPSKLA